MKQLIITIVTLTLASCQLMKSDDPSSVSFSIPKGSTLSLNKNIEIPEGKTLAVFQSGESTTARKKDIYELNCNFELIKPGPRTIKPEVFTVRHTEDWRERISRVTVYYYTEVYLDSAKGTDVTMLLCQKFSDWSDYHFTASEMEKTLGDYFSFNFTTQ